VTCDGRHVLSAWSCISDGELCSGAGTCVEGKCNCDEGLVGTYCQMNATVSSSSDDALTITLVGFYLLCAIARTARTAALHAPICVRLSPCRWPLWAWPV
jgi:hypothetical protein